MSTEEIGRKIWRWAGRQMWLRRLVGKRPERYSWKPSRGGGNASSVDVKDAELPELTATYSNFEVAPISYGTVRDLTDSVDHIRGVATTNFDMKDMQRAWMIKAILGKVPRGAKICEIGAGEPIVAGVLSRLGYDVTVVDPYDGNSNGPEEFDLFVEKYPDVRLIRDVFPPRQELGDDFGAVYSISVLEHVPIDPVIEGARKAIASAGGVSIHAIDHVLAGWEADKHDWGLRRMVELSALSLTDLDAVLAKAADDPETYFVSAEAHDRWRDNVPYDDYPMRRIISVNICGGP